MIMPDPLSPASAEPPLPGASADAVVPAWMPSAGRVGLEMAGWGYLLMVVLVCVDVIGRRLLGVSTAATTEIGGYLLAFGIAWGLAGTLLERSHIRIDVLVHRLAPGPRVVFHLLGLTILSVVALAFVFGGFALTRDSLMLGATDLTPLAVPLALPQALWTVGLAAFALCALTMTWRVARLALGGRIGAADAACMPKTYQDEAAETLDALAQAASIGRAAAPSEERAR